MRCGPMGPLECFLSSGEETLQGYLTHKKTHFLRTLPYAYAKGSRGVLGGWVFSHGRDTPVGPAESQPHDRNDPRDSDFSVQKRGLG